MKRETEFQKPLKMANKSITALNIGLHYRAPKSNHRSGEIISDTAQTMVSNEKSIGQLRTGKTLLMAVKIDTTHYNISCPNL